MTIATIATGPYSQILTNPLLVEGLSRPVGPALILLNFGSFCHTFLSYPYTRRAGVDYRQIAF